MPTTPLQDLTVNHARLFGRAGGRGVLEAGLGAVRASEVVPPGEVLFVPRMRLTEPLSPDLPPSRVAARLTDQLRRIAGDALVDSVVHSGAQSGSDRPLRFRSFAAYAAWLLAGWLDTPSHVSKSVLRAALGEKSIEQWQRQTVLADGRTVVHVARLLAQQGLAAKWLMRLDPADLNMALAAIARDYILPDLAEADAAPSTAVVAQTAGSIAAAVAGFVHVAAPQHRPAAFLQSLRKRVDGAVPAFNTMPRPARLLLIAAFGIKQRPGELRRLSVTDWQASIDGVQAVSVANEMPLPTRAQQVGSASAPIPHVRQIRASGEIVPRRDMATVPLPHAETYGRRAKNSAGTAAPDAPVVTPLPVSDSETVVQTAQPDPSQTAAFSTGFGGLFFLLNVLLWMELFPDFSRPRDKGLAASPFWLLAQLGRRLFGQAFTRDPLFAWLTEHGTRAPLPRRWQLDSLWLEGLEQPYQLPKKGGWLTRLVDFLRFRLSHSAYSASVDLLRLNAHVSYDEDHLKVRFCLAELPLALRIAGLDRDPGWLPSEGRQLTFEFN